MREPRLEITAYIPQEGGEILAMPSFLPALHVTKSDLDELLAASRNEKHPGMSRVTLNFPVKTCMSVMIDTHALYLSDGEQEYEWDAYNGFREEVPQ